MALTNISTQAPPVDSKPKSTRRLPTSSLFRAPTAIENDAFDQLFLSAAVKLRLFLLIRVGTEPHALELGREILRDTYLRAHKGLRGLKDRTARTFGLWICCVAETCVVDRANPEYVPVKNHLPAHRVKNVLDLMSTSVTDPDKDTSSTEQQLDLDAAVTGLPVAAREAMLLRYFQGLNIRQISIILGVSPASTRKLLSVAHFHLGDMLKAG